MTTEEEEKFQREIQALQTENQRLRGILGRTSANCIHCGLPAGRTYDCALGFPGCRRMEDVLRDPQVLATPLPQEESDEDDRPTRPDIKVPPISESSRRIPDEGISRINLHDIDPDEE